MFNNFTSEAFKAWAGAWLDTEGYITISYSMIIARDGKTKRRRHALRVGICQSDERPLKIIQEAYGGSINVKKKIPLCWSLNLQSKASADFLKDVLPYLIVKKEVAIVAIQFQEYIEKSPKGFRTTKEEWRERNLFRRKVNRTVKGRILLSESP